MASSAAVRAGRAFVEFFGEDSKLQKTLKAIEKRMVDWGKKITAIGKSVFAMGAGALTPLLAVTAVFESMGSTLADISGRTGASVEALSTLGYAAEQSGSSLEELEGALKKQAKFLSEAASGGKAQNETLKQLGLTMADLKDLSPEDQFRLIGEKLNAIENPTLKAATAMDVFGKSGANLLPVIAGLEDLESRARSLGLEMSTSDAEAADTLGDAWGDLRAIAKALAFNIGAALAPSLTEASIGLADFLGGTVRWIKDNRELILTVAKVAAGVAAAGAALVVVGGIISGIGTLIGSAAGIITGGIAAVTATFAGLSAVVAFVLSPLGLVLAALTAGVLAWVAYSETASKAIEWVTDLFLKLKDQAMKTFQGIADALAVGDVSAAGKILWLSLKLLWADGTAWLTEQWESFLTSMVNSASEIAKRISGTFIDMGIKVAQSLLTVSDVIGKALGKDLIDPAKRKALEKALPFLGAGMKAVAPGAIDGFNKGFASNSKARRDAAANALLAAQDDFNKAVEDAAAARAAGGGAKGKAAPRIVEGLEALATGKTSVSGTFSASAVSGLSTGRTIENIANNTKQANGFLKQIAQKQAGLGIS